MKYRLYDLADVIRSKNSGPYELTFDIIFKDEETYRFVRDAGVINRKSFASMYGISQEMILAIIAFDPARAIKITIRRPLCSGDPGETDVYGAQQHAPLLDFRFDIPEKAP